MRRYVMAGLAVGISVVPVSVSADSEIDALKQKLESRFEELKGSQIKATPIAGLFEVSFGAQIAYVTGDGKFMFTGNLIDLDGRRNLTNERRAALVKNSLASMPDSTMIVFAPKEFRRTITVFTDVDCPYCAKLHQEVPAMNKAGIKVRYLLFPRAGKNSDSYWRSVAVWCSSDPKKAIGIAKSGGKLEMKKCKNPVDAHLALGEQYGVTGTPTILLDDGRVLPGYVPAAEMARVLDLSDGGKAATSK